WAVLPIKTGFTVDALSQRQHLLRAPLTRDDLDGGDRFALLVEESQAKPGTLLQAKFSRCGDVIDVDLLELRRKVFSFDTQKLLARRAIGHLELAIFTGFGGPLVSVIARLAQQERRPRDAAAVGTQHP